MNAYSIALVVTLVAVCAGCATIPLPQEYRLHTKKDCTVEGDNCDVDVEPWLLQWVPEEIISKNGQKLHFKVKYFEFADRGVSFEKGAGDGKIICENQNKNHVKCENNGDLNVKYPYTIRILLPWPWPAGTVKEYDPFVWNR